VGNILSHFGVAAYAKRIGIYELAGKPPAGQIIRFSLG
jgi:hypothetical protein